MKIAIFGDSHTQGISRVEDGRSWTDELAEIRSDWIIDSYAISGSNIQFQLFLYHIVKTEKPNYYDKIVFQVPDHERFTYFLNNVSWITEYRIKNKNHTKYEYWEPRNNVQFFSKDLLTKINDDHWFWETDTTKRQFCDIYYQKANTEIIGLESDILTQYIVTNTDVSFYIWPNLNRKLNMLPTMETICDQQDWDSWLAYDKTHLTKPGQQFVAKWVAEQIVKLVEIEDEYE